MAESEFGGGGTMKNTLYPQPSVDDLDPSDLLRLISITGQEDTTNAEPDPYFWYGNVPPEPVIPTPRPRIPSQSERYRTRGAY